MNRQTNRMLLSANKGVIMRSILIGALFALLSACNTSRGEIDQVQTNIVDKSMFEGEWFTQLTMIDVTGDNALFTGEFVGDSAYDLGSYADIAGTYPATMMRVRWVIERDALYGFRSGEIVVGGNVNANDPDFLGEPLFAFPIKEHLDVRNGYNPVTGEEANLRVENTTDRRWYERQYMRVDWGTNLIGSALADGWIDEPAPLLAEEGSVWPERWQPQFVRPMDDPQAPYADEFRNDEVYYMSLVVRYVRSPGMHCFMGHGPCTSLTYTGRMSLLKSSPNHQYRPLIEQGPMYDRFGFIRLGIPTYSRGGENDPQNGITPDYGATDFVNYYALRHNFWRNHSDENGDPLPDTELWTPDNIRPIQYIMNDRYPTYLIRPGMYVFLEWNRAFAAMVRRHNGLATPEETPEEDDDYDCAIVGSDVAVEYPGEPVGAYPTSYDEFDADRGLRMEGDECYVKVDVNPCDATAGAECIELGDIRYHFFNLIPDPGPWFCGVSIPTSDPRSGELITANINTTTQCLDNAMTRFMDYVRVLRDGTLDDAGIISGEDIREYLASDGRVRYPHAIGPEGPLYNPDADDSDARPNFGADSGEGQDGRNQRVLRERLERLRRLQGVEGRAAIFSDAMRSLEGSGLERQMLDMLGPDAVSLARQANPAAEIAPDALPTDDAVAAQISPFRGGGLITALRNADPVYRSDWPVRPGRIYEPQWERAFQDPNIEAVIDTIPDSIEDDDDKISIWIRRRILLWVMLHELGHSMGMEHNFAGSIDKRNYLDTWYEIDEQHRLPRPNDDAYRLDSEPTAERVEAFERDLQIARAERDAAGIAMSQYTSVMDYMGLAERMTPKLGKYDVAAVSWAYGNEVELYDGDPRIDDANDDFEIDPRSVPRMWLTHYQGGERCSTSTDCPFADADQPIRQRCMENPRYQRQPVLCGSDPTTPDGQDRDCMCSAFDEDVTEAATQGFDCNGDGNIRGAEVRWDCDDDGDADYWPVDYMTCSNERLNDISWCNMFDRGSTFREVVKNFQDSYNRYYVWRNFRRHNPAFTIWSGAAGVAGSIYDAAKIYQHLIYRWIYDEEFLARSGSLGFDDQYLASVDTMNWMASILAQPDVGSYDLDEDESILRQVSSEPDGTGDFDLPMGPGKWLWSLHQGNEFGVFFTERAGVLSDKFLAYEALARRDWNLSYTVDERFYINFYDFFPSEMGRMFGGAVRGDVHATGAYFDGSDQNSPTVVFPNVWQGLGGLFAAPELCIDPEAYRPAGMPAIGGAIPLVLREYAAALALSSFAVYFDTTFAQQMYIFVEGSGEGVVIPTNDPDGRELLEDVDYVRYTSETRGKTYVSLQVDPPLRYPGCPEPSITFEMLARAKQTQTRLQGLREDLEAGSPPAGMTLEELEDEVGRLTGEMATTDSMIELLIEMQRKFGISNYFM